jgi:hypothetical protein
MAFLKNFRVDSRTHDSLRDTVGERQNESQSFYATGLHAGSSLPLLAPAIIAT